ncbi:hypothetical protein RFI_32967, partial [Reticulomyxa filosa]
MGNQVFPTLKELPVPLNQAQCVLHEHELLICGGDQQDCYSYHTLKNEYKFICKYPFYTGLYGHCVVKLVDNNNKQSNQITLLSFGGGTSENKHALVMKYVSVWSDISDVSNNSMKSNKSKKFKKYNTWIPFTDNHHNQINIGRDDDNYIGMRAVIGGVNNDLLFITYYKNNIIRKWTRTRNDENKSTKLSNAV